MAQCRVISSGAAGKPGVRAALNWTFGLGCICTGHESCHLVPSPHFQLFLCKCVGRNLVMLAKKESSFVHVGHPLIQMRSLDDKYHASPDQQVPGYRWQEVIALNQQQSVFKDPSLPILGWPVAHLESGG